MSDMYEPGYDYYHEPTEFEQQVDELKEALRKSVKTEITDELVKLRATVKEQGAKLKNLKTLEAEARAEKNAYEWKMSRAERDAEDKVRKEGIRKLLDVLAEPRYKIERNWEMGPKCDQCNEQRQLAYTTPRGKAAAEMCECAVRPVFYKVEEQLVHEISKRNGELVVWYTSAGKFFTTSEDTISSGSVLKPAAGVSDEALMEHPTDYGYVSKEDAQRIADALNAEDKEAGVVGF